VSKERARRREERDREAAIKQAARVREVERRERRASLRRAVVPRLPHRSRPTGALAVRRRRQTGATVALLLGLNLLVWLVFPEWSVRALVLCVTLLGAPVLHTMLFRRS
jgi:Flp pilus assembly protein TadB